MSAVVNNRINIIKALLNYGADTNIKNNEGKTALDMADDDEIITLLKQHNKSS